MLAPFSARHRFLPWHRFLPPALAADLEEGYLQAVRGELIDGEQAFREIELMKDDWRKSNR